MDDEPTFDLALRFDTDNPEFIRGCEVGMLYEKIGSLTADESETFMAHSSNAEMILRLAECFGRSVVTVERGPCSDTEDWLEVTFGPRALS